MADERGSIPQMARHGGGSELFAQANRIVNGGMHVARGHGVADAKQLVFPPCVAFVRLWAPGDESRIVHFTAIHRIFLECELQILQRQGA